MRRFIEVQVLLLAPICPHWAEHIWQDVLGKQGSIMHARWPEVEAYDPVTLLKDHYLRKVLYSLRKGMEKAQAKMPGADAVLLYVASEYPDWQQAVMKMLAESYDEVRHTAPAALCGMLEVACVCVRVS